MRALLVLSLLVTGCTGEPARPVKTKAQRLQEAEIAVSKTPAPRTYRIDGSEFKVLEFPVKDGLGFLDMQRCFLWRDAEFKTASLSCEKAPDLALPVPSPKD